MSMKKIMIIFTLILLLGCIQPAQEKAKDTSSKTPELEEINFEDIDDETRDEWLLEELDKDLDQNFLFDNSIDNNYTIQLSAEKKLSDGEKVKVFENMLYAYLELEDINTFSITSSYEENGEVVLELVLVSVNDTIDLLSEEITVEEFRSKFIYEKESQNLLPLISLIEEMEKEGLDISIEIIDEDPIVIDNEVIEFSKLNGNKVSYFDEQCDYYDYLFIEGVNTKDALAKLIIDLKEEPICLRTSDKKNNDCTSTCFNKCGTQGLSCEQQCVNKCKIQYDSDLLVYLPTYHFYGEAAEPVCTKGTSGLELSCEGNFDIIYQEHYFNQKNIDKIYNALKEGNLKEVSSLMDSGLYSTFYEED